MTTLYRPVLIETAEQAEALPIGTIATSAQDAGGVWRKRTATSWARASMKPSLWTNHGIANPDAAITALVPIEAEEEATRLLYLDGRMDGYSFEAGDELPEEFFNGPPRSRYVTEWTEKEE